MHETAVHGLSLVNNEELRTCAPGEGCPLVDTVVKH